jgi:hypothetical protein
VKISSIFVAFLENTNFKGKANKHEIRGVAKGQMISEGNCGFLNFPKKSAHYFTI